MISAVQRLTTSLGRLARFGGRHQLAPTRFLIEFAEGAHLLARHGVATGCQDLGGCVLVNGFAQRAFTEQSLTSDHLPCMPCSIPPWTGSGARWLASCAFPREFLPCPCSPSPVPWRVGVHITTFEACSSFTRVTACKVAHLPYIGFIARLRPSRLPGSGARYQVQPTTSLGGSFPHW